MTITNKMTLVVIGMLFSLCAVFAVAEFSINLALLKQEMQVQADSALQQLSVALLPILEAGDREKSEAFFAAVMSEGTLLQQASLQWLFDGDVQSWSPAVERHQQVPAWFTQLGFIEPIVLETPINNGWTDLAVLEIAVSPERAYLTLWERAVPFALFTLALVVCATLLIRFFLHRLMHPVSAMTEGARRIAELDFSANVPAIKGSEFAPLAGALNDISLQVESLFETLNEEIDALRHKYLFDASTGFPNRGFFMRQLGSWLVDADCGVVMLVDLKWLKNLPLNGGTKSLNEIMRALQRALKDVIPTTQNAVAARMGKAELAILVPSVDEKQARSILSHLIRTLNNEVINNGLSTANAFTIGIAEKQENDSVSSLVYRANTALQQAESTQQVFQFSAAEQEYSQEQLSAKLENAVNTDAFELMVQPIISKSSHTIQHYEVFAHIHIDNNLTPAAKLISALSRYSLSTQFDRTVIQHIVDIVKSDDTLPNLSVNLTSSSVKDPEFLRWLVGTVTENKLEHRVMFEFAEALVCLHPEECEVAATIFKDAGLRFGIDRFGQHLASVTYLKQLKPTFVKLDQSFLLNREDDNNHLLLKPMVKLASSLGIEVIVSAVEYQQQLNALADIKVDGYFGYISPPVPLSSLEGEHVKIA